MPPPLICLPLNRALMFVAKFFEGVVPGATATGVAEAEALGKIVGPKVISSWVSATACIVSAVYTDMINCVSAAASAPRCIECALPFYL